MNTYALIVILMGTLTTPPNNLVINVENKPVCDIGLIAISTELIKSKTPYKAFCIPTASITPSK